MNRKTISFLLLILGLMASACSPAAPAPATEMPAPTSTPVPAPTETPTPLPPMVTTNQQVNCYSGPGEKGYTLVTTIESGTQMNVVGKDASGSYWIVMDPKSNKGCWVESQFTSVQGETSVLPNLVPQPTMATEANPPENINITYKCKRTSTLWQGKYLIHSYEIFFTLTWDDKSDNETGFEIYKDQDTVPIGTVDVNVTTFDYQLSAKSGMSRTGYVTYKILAFNDVGKSPSAEKTIYYQCR